jgi:hypothetical protein
MRQICITNNIAPKLKGSGALEYQLWVDASGSLYVKFKENSDAGTFSHLGFSVAEYVALRNDTKSIEQPIGFDLEGARRPSMNNNDGAFLKAVLCHLLDEGVSK